MIRLTTLNGKEFYLNAEYIEKVEANPDTTITLFNGKKYIVADPVEEVIKKIMEYKKKISLPPVVGEE
ncbi:MAG: flagellar FlbD family protein [Fervidobacterium sp.]|nr:flagellar FlbD family protein [Fervidobacterium sp.]